MGSNSSRLGSNPSQGRLNRRSNRYSRLSSLFICGSPSSHAPLEWVEYHIIDAQNLGPPRELYEVFIEDARVK